MDYGTYFIFDLPDLYEVGDQLRKINIVTKYTGDSKNGDWLADQQNGAIFKSKFYKADTNISLELTEEGIEPLN